MRHIPDGVLRRLDDEPLAVPDRVSDHLARCGQCRGRRAQIAEDTESAAQAFSASAPLPDVDIAWARLRRELERGPEERADGRRRPLASVPRRARFPRLSLRAGLAIGAVGTVIAGTAAAATFTTVFAPTHVVPVSLSQSDLRAIADFAGLGDNQAVGGLPGPTGSRTLRFGTLTWSSATPHPASSLAVAAAQAGFPVSLPTHLPKGVGATNQFVVQPRVKATVIFHGAASGLTGSSVTLDAGPAVLTEYGGAAGTGLPTLAVATMRRPTAHSTGASLSQIEAFLLDQPGIPPQLAEEVRLLGDLRTALPVPVPPGAAVHAVRVGGWPAVLLADSSNAASAVVWEDGQGMLHVVAGILDSRDILNVADQLG